MTSRESDSSRVGHRGAWSLPSRRTAPFCPAASPGRTRSRGLARGFIPDLLDRSVLDEILTVGNQSGVRYCPRACISSGDAVAAALWIGARDQMGQMHRGGAAVGRGALSLDRLVREFVTIDR